MKKNLSNTLFILIRLTCLNKDNEESIATIDLGLIDIGNQTNLKDYLTKYCDKKEFHSLVWNIVDRYYKPREVYISFVKPEASKVGIITPSQISLFEIKFKTYE